MGQEAAYGEEANLEPKEFILNTAKEKGFRVRSGLFGLFSVQASEDSELLAHDPSLILKLEFIKKTPTISRSRSEEIERTSLIRDTFATQAVKPNSPERGVIKKENKPRSLSF